MDLGWTGGWGGVAFPGLAGSVAWGEAGWARWGGGAGLGEVGWVGWVPLQAWLAYSRVFARATAAGFVVRDR